MNNKAGGKYLYLFYTKDKNAGCTISNPVVYWFSPSVQINSKNSLPRTAYLHGNDGLVCNLTEGVAATGDRYLYYNQCSYFSDIMAVVGRSSSGAKDSLTYKNYRLVSDIDLNYDAGGRYIYLGYQGTGNKANAIRDIVCLVGKEFGEASSWYNNSNGCTYYPVGGYTGDWFNAMDMNYKAGGDYVYLYYTTDEKAGEPITNLSVAYSALSGCQLVKYFNTDQIADLNKDASSNDTKIYLNYLKQSYDSFYTYRSFFGSAFSGTTMTVTIISVIVIVAGITAAVIFTKKHKVATV